LVVVWGEGDWDITGSEADVTHSSSISGRIRLFNPPGTMK
jgi:hypothetical protein